MQEKKTLWERIFPPKVCHEDKCYNPLNLKIGSSIDFDLMDLKDLIFFVKGIREVTKSVDNTKFTDYELTARSKGKTVDVRVRCNPAEKDYLLLMCTDEYASTDDTSDELFEAMTTSTELSVTDHDNHDETVEYQRIGDLSVSKHAKVHLIHEVVHGVKSEVGTAKRDLEYWDYSRFSETALGGKTEQFLFVEVEKQNGFFRLWQGSKITHARISTFTAKE